ncbi:cytochrome P450 monooxygenase [Colletotrichum graminicola]|uniref:Cytochrome P450 monooxygenase n=1 Tax=Colletotrichum graminicola (strain M1.001 / M2 / FGSC 10212) TaxID=645133 RepID=E3R0R5_COLGM|nr:cytochrome P450 monooxygenase [Colletotrichum graminicola M1.001]EFQ36703.1 cytochrome P450 monooxygenase [Colletotrichum graminicola M1.001]WDK18575.1 cytochrome P450 monooxygenase [Colletotrichum graminicola]
MESFRSIFELMATRAAIVVFGFFILVLCLVYRALLPRPLPGIPYNEAAAKSILGDMPEMIGHAQKTGEMYDWLGAQNIKHRSPIVQVFGRPFSKPWVIISDFHETQDILVRRSKEFDRSAFTADVLGGVIPEHHSRWQTNDEYKNRRRLIEGILTPNFLNKVAAPLLHESTMRMVDLWHEKARLARGHPFCAMKDISHCQLDAVLGFTFGPGLESLSATQPNVDFLSSISSLPSGNDDHDDDEVAGILKPVNFPHAPTSPVIEVFFKLADSVETAMKSPFPLLAHWFLRQQPAMKTAIQVKEDLIKRQIDLSTARVQSSPEEHAVRCALDEMVRRESSRAAKEQRSAAFHTRLFYDELYGFSLGGHESTSNSSQWAVKTLARHQPQQAKLRSSLREVFPEAVSEKRVPTSQEIMKMRCPYLEASIEELYRTSLTAPMCVRSTTQDTQILGCRIPRDTVVFQVWNQAGYTQPGFPVDEVLRTPGARTAATNKGPVGSGCTGDESGLDPALYAPERWLVKDDHGRDVFDATRGRNMIFSMGPRSCYGRKLAYVQFRMMVVLVLWSFQLEELPYELNTNGAYDKLTREPHDCYVKLTALSL